MGIREPNGHYRKASEKDIIQAALSVINARFSRGKTLSSPDQTEEFLKLQLAHAEHEIFAVLWLNNQHKVIAFEELFKGTLDSAQVYPREVLKSALKYNAAACILCHNHPSGDPEPSLSDKNITNKLKEVLDLIDIRILDHIIVAKTTCSFAQRGYL